MLTTRKRRNGESREVLITREIKLPLVPRVAGIVVDCVIRSDVFVTCVNVACVPHLRKKLGQYVLKATGVYHGHSLAHRWRFTPEERRIRVALPTCGPYKGARGGVL